jgi:hypothetical protein
MGVCCLTVSARSRSASISAKRRRCLGSLGGSQAPVSPSGSQPLKPTTLSKVAVRLFPREAVRKTSTHGPEAAFIVQDLSPRMPNLLEVRFQISSLGLYLLIPCQIGGPANRLAGVLARIWGHCGQTGWHGPHYLNTAPPHRQSS